MVNIAENIEVEKKLFHVITHDAIKTANAAGLVYVSSGEPGYTRVRKDSGFYYMDGNKRLTDTGELERIRRTGSLTDT